MTSYDSKRFISMLLMIFGVSGIIAGGMYITGLLFINVPNILVLGVLVLMFGYQLNQEAALDEIEKKQ